MSNSGPLSLGALPNVDALLAFHRATFGDARMDDPDPPDPTGGAGAGAGTKTYDEAHVQRVAAQQKAEGEKSAIANIAEQLGMTPEEAKAKLDAGTEAERKAMGEADRKAAEAADAKTAADKATAVAAAETLGAKVTQQLLLSGLDLGDEKTKDEDRAEKIAMAARLVNVAPGADDAAIKTAVDRVKTMVPQLFAPAPEGGGGGGSDGGPGPAGRHENGGAFGAEGSAEFDRRFPKAKAAAST